MEDKKTKYYLVYENTFGGLEKLAQKQNEEYEYGRVKLYEFNVDESTLTKEEIDTQIRHGWLAQRSSDIYFSDTEALELVKRTAYDVVGQGNSNNVQTDIYNKVMDTKFRVLASMIDYADGSSRGDIDLEIDGEPTQKEYSTDIKEFEDKLGKMNSSTSFSSASRELVRLKSFEVHAQTYRFVRTTERVKKMISKVMRDNFTYCVKEGKVIVPADYLARGVEGIDEWREMKRNGNKNNSIEKRMLRQIVLDKKNYLKRGMEQIVDAIPKNARWDIPNLEVDGRFNKQRLAKLASQIINNKDPQYYIDTPEEEIIAKFKEYWKKILTDACDRIDKLEIEK